MPGTLPLRRYDAVICDIDGCLVSEHQAPFDLASLTAVAQHNTRAHEIGDRPAITLCTGRPQPFAESIARLINAMHLPIISEMGAWLYHPGTNVYTLDPAITSDHLALVHELSRWCHLTFGPMGVTQQPGKTASVTLWHPHGETLRALAPKVEEQCRLMRWPFRVSMTWHYINCDLSHISKATGLARFMQQTGLKRERLAGIGDTMSDKAIADAVAFFACPSNAHPSIKEHAHHISPHSEAQGVVEILRHLIQ